MTSPELRYVIGADDAASRVLAKVRGSLDGLKTSAGRLTAVLKPLAASLSLGAAVTFVRGINDGVDALNDIKDATGASIENLSAFEDIAARTGTRLEVVADSLVKFNTALKDAKPGSDQIDAFRRLNLDVEKLKALDPAEAMRQTAIALSRFGADGERARLVQELFGRSVRDTAPFLKNLAENGTLVAKVTTEQADAAEKFNRQLLQLKKNTLDASRVLTADLVQGINAAAAAMRNSGLSAGLSTLFFGDDQFRNDKALTEQTEALLRAEKDLSTSRAKDSQFGDRSLRTVAAEKRLAAIKEEIKLTQTYRRQLASEAAAANPKQPDLPPVPPPKREPAKQSEAARYLENLQKQLEKTRDLSVEEQLLTDLQAKRLGIVSPKLREQLVGTAQQIDAARELIQLRKDEAEALVKNSEATRQRLDGLQRENAASVEHNRQLRDSTAELGLTTTALDALRLARLDETIAHEQELLTNQRNANAAQEEIAIIERRIALKRIERDLTARSQAATRENALIGGTSTADLERKRDDMLFLTDLFERGRIGETQYLEAVTLRLGIANEGLEKSKTLAEELGGTFTSAFEDAIVGGKGLSSLLKGLEQDILRIVTRKLVTEPLGNAITGALGGGGGLGSIFEKIGTSIFGGFKAEGGPVSAGVPYIVGEQGPELFMPRSSGTIVPNGGMGGNTVNITINQTFAAGTNRATLMQAAADARRQLEYAGRNL